MNSPSLNLPPSVAIIGAGLSGTLVAANLLRLAQPGTRITLFDRSPRAGPGVAYGTPCDQHLLNVPAGRMTAWPDEPGHFLEWVTRHLGQPGFPASAAATDFLPRKLFGVYLGEVLNEAIATKAPGVEFSREQGEAVDLDETATGGRIRLLDGGTFEANRVVLALGNLPGEYPIAKPLPFYRGKRYVHLPWSQDALERIEPGEDVLVVGAGLTAIDVIVQLDEHGHRGTIHALSRRGLRPVVHQAGPAYRRFLEGESIPTTVRGILHRVRAEIRIAQAQGIGWRGVIDALRPDSQAIWQGLSWEERARFLRHARPHWEVHRHRIAPAVASVVARCEAERRVAFHAGRLQSLTDHAHGAQAVFRRRGTARTRRAARGQGHQLHGTTHGLFEIPTPTPG